MLLKPAFYVGQRIADGPMPQTEEAGARALVAPPLQGLDGDPEEFGGVVGGKKFRGFMVRPFAS